MTNPQTEAQAIAERLMLPDEDVFNLAVDIIATALAAKDAELSEANARAERQWAGWVKEEALRKAAEAQLAEANKALERALAERAGGVKVSRQSILDAVRSFDLEGGNIPERFADHLASALESAAPEERQSSERTCATCHAVLADGPQPFATYAPDTRPAEQAVTEVTWALKASREIVDAVAGENRPARDWAIRVRDRIDAALAQEKGR